MCFKLSYFLILIIWKNMKKIKFNLNNEILDKITNSFRITENEKISFLKYISYLTVSEQKELSKLL